MTGQPMDADGAPVTEEFIADQLSAKSYVFWEDYLAGPGKVLGERALECVPSHHEPDELKTTTSRTGRISRLTGRPTSRAARKSRRN
jgi:hypothetical protein